MTKTVISRKLAEPNCSPTSSVATNCGPRRLRVAASVVAGRTRDNTSAGYAHAIRLTLIKVATNSAQPANEGEVDVYPGAGFLEFEVQGPYTQIAASGNLPWSIEWRVVMVPTSVTIGVGSASLVELAKPQL